MWYSTETKFPLQDNKTEEVTVLLIDFHLVMTGAPVCHTEDSALGLDPLQQAGGALVGISRALEDPVEALEIHHETHLGVAVLVPLSHKHARGTMLSGSRTFLNDP